MTMMVGRTKFDNNADDDMMTMTTMTTMTTTATMMRKK
jgi:hypothetical protein